MTRRSTIALVAMTAVLATASSATSAPERAAGAFELKGLVSSFYRFNASFCPAGVQSPPADCVRFTGEGQIRGLGTATTTYTKVLPGEDPSCVVVQNNTAEIAVAGKGSIDVSRAGKICTPPAPFVAGPYVFTVTGGTGAYAGASGTLTFRSAVGTIDGGCQCGSAQDTWEGTLTVPGMEFDLTAPTISGAAAKTVKALKKAKTARVRYTVSATDAVDGKVAVTCTPRSGSLFKRGRTTVKCSATDSSANTANARFVVTVK